MELIKKFECTSLAQTKEAAQFAAHLVKPFATFALKGKMGAGKTTFTTFLLEELGFTPAGSPTYAIVNEYKKPPLKLCHFDFYRLEGEEDLDDVNFYEYLDEGAALIVEWSEKFENINYKYTIKIDKTGDDTRLISIFENKD